VLIEEEEEEEEEEVISYGLITTGYYMDICIKIVNIMGSHYVHILCI
jgi:hypothetical protein